LANVSPHAFPYARGVDSSRASPGTSGSGAGVDEAIADRYDGFLLDLDGTVWVGEEAVAGAAEALARLRSAGKRLVFVTNDSRADAAELAERLRSFGIEAGEKHVLTAGAVTSRLAAEAAGAGAGAFVIGAPALHREVSAAGLRLLEGESGREAEVVVVALHRGFDYAELRTATAALRERGAKLFATNREPGLPMPDGTWPGTGAILAAVEYASGVRATIGGKPERHLFERARQLLGDAGRVAIVGDGLAADVAGGSAAGLATVLVLSGNSSRADLEAAAVAPTHVLDSLAGLA
jgi:glycerol-1-phosphatase